MKNKSLKKSIFLIILIVFLSGSLFFLGLKKGQDNSKPEITSSLINNRLSSVKELVTTEYHYKNMGSFQNQNTFYGLNLPFTEKKFIISYEGLIKVGVDLNNTKVSISDNNIDIIIPSSKIISHEIDEDSIKIFDEKTSIFNPIKVEDYASFSSDQKSKVEKDALSKGLIKEANEKSIKSIKEIINLDPNLLDYNLNIKISSIK